MSEAAPSTRPSVQERIAAELGVGNGQVRAAVELLDGGSTVPFVARYRKEATGALDDAQLRTLNERLTYLRELDERRAAVLESVREQGKLTGELAAAIEGAETKARLEDIYLPFKPKRRTRAQVAREQGLEPLADLLFDDPTQDPQGSAAEFTGSEVADAKTALDGARAILVERFGEDADLVGQLRETLWSRGRLVATVREGKRDEGATFADYFDFAQPLTELPSHRVLAMLRGEREGVLDLTLSPEPDSAPGAGEPAEGPSRYEQAIAERFGIADRGRAADTWLTGVVRWAWRTRILIRLDVDLRGRLRAAAEDAAVGVFAANLRDLLLAAPAGTRPTMGLDPGLRTGVKVAVVDATGKVTETATVHPHAPARRWDESLDTLEALARKHAIELVAIGNGTASRETDKLAGELAKRRGVALRSVVVSEAGASVYSASEYASAELPELDVSLRGAVSIARRLQDPLAELVKIDPRSIGVGQYQHDLSELKLARSLDAVVEDCVNAVGVDVNTASVPLLARVSGVSSPVAENIVAHRDQHGSFRSRVALKQVARLGPKAFEQCAGFLRIRGGDDPMDASAVHPEAYPVVRRILDATGSDVMGLVGNTRVLRALRAEDFTDGSFGVPTVTDILAELDKPGRDPRPEFVAPSFAEGVDTLADLRPGMVLEGAVTNVAAFGAFVDVGVHQDGLVHVSAMAKRFVSDPREVVRSGDVVRVKVLKVDVERKRIGLALRLDDPVDGERGNGGDAGVGAAPQRGEEQAREKQDRSSQRSDKTRADKPGGDRSGGSKQGAGKQGRRGNGGRGGKQQAADGAMADALRRAGLTER